MIIVKLGGSVITDKNKENTARKRVIKRLIQEIKKADRRIILVHGAGSFGHIHAERYHLDKGFENEEQLKGFSITHLNVRRLNRIIIDCLQRQGIPSISIPPLSVVEMSDGRLRYISTGCFVRALSLNLTPVTFGDVVFDEKRGFSICSGDMLVLGLSRYFEPERVIFVIDEDGIFDKDPKLHGNAKLLTTIDYRDLPSSSEMVYPDVTGGMGGKIEVIKRLAEQGTEVVVVNGNKRGRLYRSLKGERVKGTLVTGG